MSDNKKLASSHAGGAPGGGAMGAVQGMLAAMQQQTSGSGPQGHSTTTFFPTDAPGNLMQHASISSSDPASGQFARSNVVGAHPDAHTTQSYDPTTNTLITTTVDPATGATTTTMTSGGGGGSGGMMMSSSQAFASSGSGGSGGAAAGGGGAPSSSAPPQTARVTELDD